MIIKAEWNDNGWIGYCSDTAFSSVVVHDINTCDGIVVAQMVFAGDESNEGTSTRKRDYLLYRTAMDKEGNDREFFIIYGRRVYLDDVMHREYPRALTAVTAADVAIGVEEMLENALDDLPGVIAHIKW